MLSRSSSESEAIGRRIGERLQGGEVIALSGPLGAGKTCVVRGLADGLGISPTAVHSPSFIIVAEHGGGRVPLYHIDLYRLTPQQLPDLGLHEYLEGGGVAAIEWADRMRADLPPERLEVEMAFSRDPDTRCLHLRACGDRHAALLGSVQSEEGAP